MTALRDFMAKVEQKPNGCWEWVGSRFHHGYAQFRRIDFPSAYAHRWAYHHFVGEIPDGMDLDHLCRVRHCVNPGHLEPVTRRENLMRGTTIPSRNAAKTHCVHGHPFDAVNTRSNADGSRECRACDRIRARRKAASHA